MKSAAVFEVIITLLKGQWIDGIPRLKASPDAKALAKLYIDLHGLPRIQLDKCVLITQTVVNSVDWVRIKRDHDA